MPLSRCDFLYSSLAVTPPGMLDYILSMALDVLEGVPQCFNCKLFYVNFVILKVLQAFFNVLGPYGSI